MKKNKWNYNHIINQIKKDGYFIFENFLDVKEINEIKNSLAETLNYIKPDKEKDLVKKYYKIKKFNKKLKGRWYDMACYNLTLYKYLHSQKIIELVKKYFKTNVVFSYRPCIHVHDKSNNFLLEPHQETNMFSKEGILLWCPLFNTNKQDGGITIYKDSHKHGFFPHRLNSSNGKKKWTKAYTNIDKSIYEKFEKVNLNVKAGSAVFIVNSMVHTGYPMKSKNKLRVTITERYNPLQNIPFLKEEKAPLRIPYTIDYNKINLDN